jgi:hypothetical protein
MDTLTIELPTEMSRALADLAERVGRSPSELVAVAISEFLARDGHLGGGPGFPLSVGIVADDEVNSENFEDWLYANWRPGIDENQP